MADLTALRRPHDLLIVGGGIHGLFAAYDAAARGLSVALVERADFGSGLSFNHQRTLHGGLRALQHGHLGKARQQIHERRTWARIAPHLIRPVPFLIGTYRWTTRSRWSIKAAFELYDVVGRSRNAGVSPELHLPRTRLETAAATRRLFSGISEKRLTGGAIWYDYQTVHPDRLLWTVALAARQHGADLCNYVEATGPLTEQGRVSGATLRDTLSGETIDAPATVTLLAAGAGLSPLLARFGASGAPPLVRAMNLLLDRPARDIALAAPSARGRMLTAVPWRQHVLVGTDQSDGFVTEDHAPNPPSDAEVDRFIIEMNTAFPALRATRRDVRLVHHGLTPAVDGRHGPDFAPEPRVIRHGSAGVANLISLVGVKFTTARWAAARAVDAVCAELHRPAGESRTARTELPHAGVADVEGRLLEAARDLHVTLPREVVVHLSSWYGTEAADVIRDAATAGQLDPLSTDTPVLSGEIAHAVQHADAKRLADAVLRRTALGSAGHPGRPALDRAADVMATLLGWSTARRADEIAAVEAVYPRATAEC